MDFRGCGRQSNEFNKIHLGINCFLHFEDRCDFVCLSLLRFIGEREGLKEGWND